MCDVARERAGDLRIVVKYGRRHTLKTLSIDATHGQRKIRSPSLSHTHPLYTPPRFFNNILQCTTTTTTTITGTAAHANKPSNLSLSDFLPLFPSFSRLSSCLFFFVLLSSLRVYQYGRNIFFSIRFYSVYFASFFLFYFWRHFGRNPRQIPFKAHLHSSHSS